MTINDKLELLKLADEFTVTEESDYFRITMKNKIDYDFKPLTATIDKNTNEVNYFINDIYDNGCNSEEIDMESLKQLMQFCKLLKLNETKRKEA